MVLQRTVPAKWLVRIAHLLRRPLRGRAGSALRSEDGSSLIEFAISLSGLMTFVFVLMELCILFYTNAMISEIAREGTRWAIVRGTTCQNSSGSSCTATPTSVKTYVLAIGYPNPGGGTITVDTTAADMYPDGDEAPGHRVKVIITYSFPVRFPFVPVHTFSLGASSQMTIIQ